MPSGYHVFSENVTALKNKLEKEKQEYIADRLAYYKGIYEARKQKPISTSGCEISVPVTQNAFDVEMAILHFLVDEEKWPKKRVNTNSKDVVGVVNISLIFEGEFPNDD
jgi:hypothetical protein